MEVWKMRIGRRISFGFIISMSLIASAYSQSGEKLVLTTGEISSSDFKSMISITLDFTRAKETTSGRTLLLEDAIVNFVLPFNKNKPTLLRSDFAGDELLNVTSIEPDPNTNTTTMICRLITKGITNKIGQIGGSIVVVLVFNKTILDNTGKGIVFPSNGKLTSSKEEFSHLSEILTQDMTKLGVVYPNYSKYLNYVVDDKTTYFYGCAFCDPTNPKAFKNGFVDGGGDAELSWNFSLAQ
jgi:hypothetical protein